MRMNGRDWHPRQKAIRLIEALKKNTKPQHQQDTNSERMTMHLAADAACVHPSAHRDIQQTVMCNAGHNVCLVQFPLEPYHDWQSAQMYGGSTDDVESNSFNPLTVSFQ